MLKKIKISLLCLLTWRMINTYLLELPLSETYLHGCKGILAAEVRLLFCLFISSSTCNQLLSQLFRVYIAHKKKLPTFISTTLKLFSTQNRSLRPKINQERNYNSNFIYKFKKKRNKRNRKRNMKIPQRPCFSTAA